MRHVLMSLGFPVLVLVLSLSMTRAQDESKSGTITGTVKFTGEVPSVQKILTSDGAVLLHNDLVVDPKTKGLRHVAVYLQDAPAQPLAKDAKPVVVDQRDMVFLPRVVVTQEGQTVRFDNNDLCNHAVNSTTTKTENLFNALTPMGQPFDFKFKAQKSPVQIGCPIHGWMRAWVYVLPHPFAAVTDAKGEFRIENVPPGKQTVVLAHPDTGLRESRMVEVESGKPARVDVEWKAIKR